MKNYWMADFELHYEGREHVWSELSKEGKQRIHHQFGEGKMRGTLRKRDFK